MERWSLLFLLILMLSWMSYSESISEEPTSPPYTWDNSRHYLMYAYSAYCGPAALKSWTCYWCTNNTTPLSVKYTFLNSSTNIFGYAGYSNKEIIVAFRGTQIRSLKNWISDLNFPKTVPYKGHPNVLVHEGFYEAYRNIQSQVRVAVTTLIKHYPNLPLVITGHSLGAALSTLAALDIVETYGLHPFVWNYGSPRVGNQGFSDWFTKNVGYIWRTTNQHDIVPHLPPRLLNFHHVATEVWFPNDDLHFVICNKSGEDPNCADSVLVATSIVDHLTYLGYNEHLGTYHGC